LKDKAFLDKEHRFERDFTKAKSEWAEQKERER
jgi:hypothetical protein